MSRIVLFFLTAALLFVSAAPPVLSQRMERPDEARTIGAAVPDVVLTDDQGREFHLASLRGKPLVLSPIFTTCPHACQMITSGLRESLLDIGPPGDSYEVITLTFDPADSLSVLRDYREARELPDGWILARADSAALDTLFDAVDFNYAPVSGGFLHANIVAVLTPDHRVSGYLYGLAYEEGEVRRALLSAVTPDSLVESFRPVIAGAALLALVITLGVLWATRRRKPGA